MKVVFFCELLGKAWPLALTPNNLISGFVKADIYPLNPSKITEKELAPSKVFECVSDNSSHDTQSLISSQSKSNQDTCTTNSSIDEILKLPRSTCRSPPKQSLTSCAQHLTDTPFITHLKEKKKLKVLRKQQKRMVQRIRRKVNSTTKGSVQSSQSKQRCHKPLLMLMKIVLKNSASVPFVKNRMDFTMRFGLNVKIVKNGCIHRVLMLMINLFLTTLFAKTVHS
jgi:hypothetical protein